MPSNAGNQQAAVNLFNTSVLKTTCDDQIESILTKQLEYKPSYALIDTRLALGYASVIVAGLTAFLDYKLGFFPAKIYTAIGVSLYVILNVAYTYWIVFVEKGVVFNGHKEASENKQKSVSNNQKLTIATKKGSKDSKYDPVYEITVTISPAGSSAQTVVSKSLQFNDYFATSGFIVFDKFAACVKNIVEEAEEKAKKTASKKKN